MGSEIVEALVIQIGRLGTTTGEPEAQFTKPIEQFPFPITKTFEPLEQRKELSTATIGSTELSNPIEQVLPPGFAITGGVIDPEGAKIIQQFILASEPLKTVGDEVYDGLLEQKRFRTTFLEADPEDIELSRPLQQFITSTNEATTKPVELVPVETNTVDITQFDFIELVFPPCNSIKNPVDADILWRIRDFGFEFDVGTLIFIVNGVEVQDDPTFVVTDIGDGLQLDYDRPEDYGFEEEVEIFLSISDTADPPNTFTYRCKWTTVPDTLAPRVFNLQPPCNSTDVDVQAPIEFDILDIGDGVDPDSIRLSVEGITVCSGVTLEATSIPGSGTGFHVTYEHEDDPFRYDSTVTIAIEAQDISDLQNSSIFICCFETESSQSPEFLNFDPEPCETFVDVDTGLSFEVYGLEDGIDISTLEVRVDNKLRKVFVRPRLLRSE